MILRASSFCFVLFLAASSAQAVEVRARLETPEIPFHRTARLVVEVESLKEIEPRIAKIEDRPDGIEVRDGGYETIDLDDTRRLLRQTWTIHSPNIGLYRIPPVTVTWNEESTTTQALVLRVRELTEAEQGAAENFIDITTPAPLSTTTGTVLRWVAALTVCSMILAALLWLLLRKKEVPAAPPAKPWEVADKRLAELRRRDLPAQGAFDQYYVDLSAILRYYLEDRFHLHAPDLTTPELLQDVVERKLLNEIQQDFLASFLRHCDYVKFAQYKPSSEEMAGGFTTVRQFVYDTIPKPAADAETEAA